MTHKLNEICLFLEEFAPSKLAADWDNVGLLVGDPQQNVSKVMTCLTVTLDVVAEAVEQGVQVIVSHHPMPFKSVRRITTGSIVGKMLLQLVQNQVAVYSPHTAFDSAEDGINQAWAEGLGLEAIAPMEPVIDMPELGTGRLGTFSAGKRLEEIVPLVKELCQVERLRVIGELDQPIRKVGIACGSAGEFLSLARRHKCQLFITGETTFHTCLDARAHEVAMLLTGHFASERFAVEQLAKRLQNNFPTLDVWPSRAESNPWQEV